MSCGTINFSRVIKEGLSGKWQLSRDLKERKEIMFMREHSRESSKCRDLACICGTVLSASRQAERLKQHVRGSVIGAQFGELVGPARFRGPGAVPRTFGSTLRATESHQVV